jgi:GNAT superfamily N-acetyltransferase
VISVRSYQESDAQAVGRLIHDTYGQFNLSFLPEEERGPYLGPFRHSRSEDNRHKEEIARTIQAEIVLVAEENERIVGVLRGKKDRLQSLFVSGEYHGKGIGRALVERFENMCLKLGSEAISVASSLFAVSFYRRLGYRKSGGVRIGQSFQGTDFKSQPMKKSLG